MPGADEPCRRVSLRLSRAPALFVDGTAYPLSTNDAALLTLAARLGPLDRGWVAATLWPESSAAAALGSLRQRDYRLAKAAGRPLLSKGQSIALLPDVAHDLHDPAARLADVHESPGAQLLSGIDFTERPALARCIDAERERWRQEWLDALHRLTLQRENEGRYDEALRLARHWCLAAPCSELATRSLMRLHHRGGDRAAALAVFEAFKHRLYEELGERPDDAIVTLAEQIAAARMPPAPVLPELPEALRHPPRTVGREALVAQVRQRLAQPAVVLLTGPAGIGKTRVFDEVRHLLAPAVLVFRLNADDTDEPLSLVRRLAEVLAPGLGRQLPETLVFEALRDALADRPASPPTVVAIEDLHFADSASAALLTRLLRVTLPVGWLLTCRDESIPEPVQRWIDAQEALDEAQFKLPPLTEAQIAGFVASVHPQADNAAQWAGLLALHAGGHPLSMLQVLRALHDHAALGTAPPAALPVPREAMHRVGRLLDRCDERAQQLAFVAALSGGQFGVPLAMRVLRCSATELSVPWRRLQAIGLLRENGYTHELVRQAVLQALPPALAPPMHREIAAALQEAGAAPARRAFHWKAAACWPEAAADLLRAASEARASGLRGQARQWMLEAADCWRQAGRNDAIFDALERAFPLTLELGSAEEADAELLGLQQLAAGDAQQCRVLLLQSRLQSERQEAAGLGSAQAARDIADRLGDPRLGARASLRLAMAEHLVGQLDQALDQLAQAEAASDHLEPEERHELLDGRATLLASTGCRREAATVWHQAFEQVRNGHDLARSSDHASNAAVQYGYLGETEAALELAECAMALDQRVEAAGGFAGINAMSVAALCADTGRFARALAVGEQCLEHLRQAGLQHYHVSAGNTLAHIHLLLGRADLALRLLPDAPEQVPAWAHALRRAAQARLKRARGLPWLAQMQEAREVLQVSGALSSRYASWRVDLEIARGADVATRRERTAACAEWARREQHLALRRHADFLHIGALLEAGDSRGAAHLADRLQEEAEGRWTAFDFYLPELWWALVQAWDAAGAPAKATAMALEAWGWIDHVARHEVPELFRETFLQRNPANQLIGERARR